MSWTLIYHGLTLAMPIVSMAVLFLVGKWAHTHQKLIRRIRAAKVAQGAATMAEILANTTPGKLDDLVAKLMHEVADELNQYNLNLEEESAVRGTVRYMQRKHGSLQLDGSQMTPAE